MADVLLFWNIDMAAVMSCEKRSILRVSLLGGQGRGYFRGRGGEGRRERRSLSPFPFRFSPLLFSQEGPDT